MKTQGAWSFRWEIVNSPETFSSEACSHFLSAVSWVQWRLYILADTSIRFCAQHIHMTYYIWHIFILSHLFLITMSIRIRKVWRDFEYQEMTSKNKVLYFKSIRIYTSKWGFVANVGQYSFDCWVLAKASLLSYFFPTQFLTDCETIQKVNIALCQENMWQGCEQLSIMISQTNFQSHYTFASLVQRDKISLL